jgi:hypothetical protein
MVRYVAGGASALLLIAAGFFIWRSGADAEDPIPPAPPASQAASYRPLTGPGAAPPPAASEQSKDARRFARADRDRDGRITLDEQLQPRRKAFAKADRDGNGSLSFEEWTAPSAAKFVKADKDRSGGLDPAEYAATRPKVKPRPKCRC